MRALVTGGAGFIGSHLVEFLLDREWTVDVIDDFSTGRMENLPKHPNLTIEGRSIWRPNVQDGRRCVLDRMIEGVDAVFHLASIVGVQRVIKWPLRTIEENIESTAAVLHFAARHRKPTLITSSSEVYGRAFTPLLSEDLDIHIGANVRWGYAAAKAVDEFTALAHYKETGLQVVVCRLFNTIGPRQRGAYGMVVPRFIDQAIAGKPITVFGDGRQRRSFTWVEDVVDAMVKLVFTRAAHGQIVNVGSVESISILDLAKLIRTKAGSSSEIVNVPQREAYGLDFQDIESRVPDLSKIRSLIQYHPTRDIDDMIGLILKHRMLTEARS